MKVLTTLTRFAGLSLCVVAFAGTAAAGNGGGNGNGNGNGNGHGNAGTPPGQERKQETPAPAAAPAPAAQAPAQEHKGGKPEDKAAPAAKAGKPAKAAKPEKAPAKAEKSEQKSSGKSSGSYKNTSLGNDLKKGMDHKHTICHATGSSSNPYVVITPSVSGVFNGHMDHQGDEDIVPPFMYKGTWYSQNWDAAGQAMFANGCRAPAAAPQQQATDVCPNIEGHQETIPAGHVKDAQGNCVQPPADVCPNIEGMQTTIPAGLVKDSLGNCVTPAAAASVDVCPNLEGMQTAVPAGLVRNAEGHCVAPAAPAAAVTASAPAAGQVLGASTPAKAAPKKKSAAPAVEKPASGVLGAVASAPRAIGRTATTGTLPFTGLPLWIAVLFGGGLLAAGLVLRRASTTG